MCGKNGRKVQHSHTHNLIPFNICLGRNWRCGTFPQSYVKELGSVIVLKYTSTMKNYWYTVIIFYPSSTIQKSLSKSMTEEQLFKS